MQRYRFSAIFMVFVPLILSAIFMIFMLSGKIIYMNIEYPTYKDVQIKTAQTHNAEILIIGKRA